MNLRLMSLASLGAPLAFAAITLATPDARADAAAVREVRAGSRSDVRPWSRRFPPRPTAPAALAIPRVPAQPKAPPVRAPAPRAAAPAPAVVAVEIREIRAGAPTQIERFSLPLGDHGSTIESRVADAEYRISVHRAGSGAGAPLGFDVRKSLHLPKGQSTEARVLASVRLSAGQHVVIAAMDRPDGSRTEVLAQLQ